jgi:pimeloyl-ACP methyl ester carboxylesterase
MENIEYIKAKIDFLMQDSERYFEQMELKYLELKLNQMQREMWAWFYQQKYDPNQPRRRDGSPQSGEWVEYGVVMPDKSDDLFFVKTIKTPSGKRLNRANIFIGGGADRSDGNNVLTSKSMRQYTYGDNYYATWDSKNKIIKLINKMPKGRQINLIGHSYGGDTAGWVVEKLPNRIYTLATIDPVGGDTENIQTLKNKTKLWINVNAVGEGVSIGDFLAGVGGAWNDAPDGHADKHLKMPFNHGYFDSMLFHRFDGKISIQNILNKY